MGEHGYDRRFDTDAVETDATESSQSASTLDRIAEELSRRGVCTPEIDQDLVEDDLREHQLDVLITDHAITDCGSGGSTECLEFGKRGRFEGTLVVHKALLELAGHERRQRSARQIGRAGAHNWRRPRHR